MPRFSSPSLSLAIALVYPFVAGRRAGAAPDFEKKIRPILQNHCVECHGANKQKGELRLDAKSFAFRGGHDGPAIVPGKSGESHLFLRVSSADGDERMPPEKAGNPLSAEQIALLKEWIDSGAEWPETEADRLAARDPRLDHWAWKPVSKPPVPTVAGTGGKNPIDAFLRVKLAEKGLVPSPEAEPAALLRRLSFDLIGLPPTFEETNAFTADFAAAPDAAVARAIDRLLASPRYGERWAQHWLDTAHYGDTHGFERDMLRPNAWPYRDYVIRSLNEDKRYDDFLREQIAGDILRPEDPTAVTATGFLAAGPWDFVGQVETVNPALNRAARADDLDDMVTQVMTASTALTVNCARCHDHKLDPISQREYYALCAVFSGVKRGDRPLPPGPADEPTQARKAALENEIAGIRAELALGRWKTGRDLADIVAGGDGTGTGNAGFGIDPVSGRPQEAKRTLLENAPVNTFVKSSIRFIDGTFLPNGGDTGEVIISSTGLKARGVPATSGQAWDAIRSGPVNSQFTTVLGGVDYAAAGYSLLSLHANSGITFDLDALRQAGAEASPRLRAKVGYFGQTPKNGATLRVYLDGEEKASSGSIGHDDGAVELTLEIPATARFLTFMATDDGNGISHDQIGLVDARLEPLAAPAGIEAALLERDRLFSRRAALEKEIQALPGPAQLYGVLTDKPAAMHLMKRGDPEQPGEAVTPGAVAFLPGLPAEFGGEDLSDSQRRTALARWITDPANPLTRRVMMNRLWHYHFGTGLVDTPSDFGLGGGLPSHPELLDWLGEEFAARGWSLKAMHRLICSSAAYRQSSRRTEAGMKMDAANRLLWRMNPIRLDAESVRDAVLAVSGKLNLEMFGPGYRDFDYTEEYAPVYKFIVPDKPDLWRRTVYRFVVRTTTHQFLTTLDCPNPANLTPARNMTTTALQSLALLNNGFMLKQADHFAERVRALAGDSAETQVREAFRLAFSREPAAGEVSSATAFLRSRGLAQLCRMLFNANEFIYVD